jgi:hypothetical protein
MPISPEVAYLRARHANAKLRGDETVAAECKRDLAAQRIEEFIKRTVDAAPPLTSEQRTRLAGILRGTPSTSAGGGTDAAA